MKKIPLALTAAFALATLSPGQARNAPYTVSPDLREVVNRTAFAKALGLRPAHRAMLARNLFVVAPSDSIAFEWVYGRNDYMNLPSCVTPDAAMHLYHVIYDATLRTMEQDKLLPKLKRLTSGMLAKAVQDHALASGEWKDAALRNVAYFGVADRLLGGTGQIPEGALGMLRQDLGAARGARGSAESAIFEKKVDFTQFIARGHYTKSEKLKTFFRAMMWYGLVPFELAAREEGVLKPRPRNIRMALLLVRGLKESGLDKEWEAIYEPTTLFVGASNSLTPSTLQSVAATVLATPDAEDYDRLVAELAARHQPRIKARRTVDQNYSDPELQFKFMGQRYIPDSDILQRLTAPVVRPVVSGLDVMDVLGSTRARAIIDANPAQYNPKGWAEYDPERQILRAEFAALPEATWQSNLYYGWLYALKATLEPVPQGYPSFMQKPAWGDLALQSALGWWTELRHDTLLYGEQSVSEMGGGDEEVPYTPGYVVPHVPFYDRLIALTKGTQRQLLARDLLSVHSKKSMAEFLNLLTFLRAVSVKELRNERLTKAEHLRIRHIEAAIADPLHSMLQEGRDRTMTLTNDDLDIALVADFHTADPYAVTAATGRADDLLAIVPIDGKLYLARGSVFSYYEFLVPTSERLTDEKWRARLNAKKAPPRPKWQRSFFVNERLRSTDE